MPNGGVKKLLDYKLSRYACYLIVQNSDSRKEVVALGQTYFAVQTRKQELIENCSIDRKNNFNEKLICNDCESSGGTVRGQWWVMLKIKKKQIFVRMRMKFLKNLN